MTFSHEGSLKAFRTLDPWHQRVCRGCDGVSDCEQPKSDETLLLFWGFFLLFPDAEWVGRGDTATSASDTRAAFTAPASSLGSATARRAGVAFSATKVSSPSLPECEL